MSEYKKFRISEIHMAELRGAARVVPYIVVGGIEPMSPAEHVNRLWQRIAPTYGVRWDTVRADGLDAFNMKGFADEG